MNARHRVKAKEKDELIKYKTRLVEKFIFIFSLGLVLCLLVFLDMFLYSVFDDKVHLAHILIFAIGAGVALVLQIVEWMRKKGLPKWLVWIKRWFFLGGFGAGLVLLQVLLGKIKFEWFKPIRKFMHFGDEMAAIRWCFLYIGIGVAISFVIYIVKNIKANKELKHGKRDKTRG